MFALLKKYDCISFRPNNNQENALHIAAYYNKHRFIREFRSYESTKMFTHHQHHQHDHECTYSDVNRWQSEQQMAERNDTDDNDEQQQQQQIPCMCRCEMDDAVSENRQQNYYLTSCVKQRDKNYYTPLMCAIAAGNQKCVVELLAVAAGAEAMESDNKNDELEAKDKEGNTVYHLAVDNDNVESLRYLLMLEQSKADVIFARNNSDETILHAACRIGNLEVVKLILNRYISFQNKNKIKSFAFI